MLVNILCRGPKFQVQKQAAAVTAKMNIEMCCPAGTTLL